MWSRRKFPRKSSRRKVRPAHSFSRDSSTIFRDSSSLVSRASVALKTVPPCRARTLYQPRRGQRQLSIAGGGEGTLPVHARPRSGRARGATTPRRTTAFVVLRVARRVDQRHPARRRPPGEVEYPVTIAPRGRLVGALDPDHGMLSGRRP